MWLQNIFLALAIGNPCSKQLIFETGGRSEIIPVVLVSSLVFSLFSDLRSDRLANIMALHGYQMIVVCVFCQLGMQADIGGGNNNLEINCDT